jgi:hypothetical protein
LNKIITFQTFSKLKIYQSNFEVFEVYFAIELVVEPHLRHFVFYLIEFVDWHTRLLQAEIAVSQSKKLNIKFKVRDF